MSKELRVGKLLFFKLEGATEQWSGDKETIPGSHGNEEEKHTGWLSAVTLAGILSDLL